VSVTYFFLGLLLQQKFWLQLVDRKTIKEILHRASNLLLSTYPQKLIQQQRWALSLSRPAQLHRKTSIFTTK
jgi:hypothetical protein